MRSTRGWSSSLTGPTRRRNGSSGCSRPTRAWACSGTSTPAIPRRSMLPRWAACGSRGESGQVKLLVRDLAQLATPAGREAPLRGSALGEIDVIEDAFILSERGVIEAVGQMRDLPALDGVVSVEIDGRGLCAVPGLVDCHTHA